MVSVTRCTWGAWCRSISLGLMLGVGITACSSSDSLPPGTLNERPLRNETPSPSALRDVDPASWKQVARLTLSDGQPGDGFSSSCAISGANIAVGVPRAGTGRVVIYSRNHGGLDAWGLLTTTSVSNALVGDGVGSSVAMDGSTLVAGAPGDDRLGSGAGAAYVFYKDSPSADRWGQVAKLVASDPQPGDSFGVSVAVSGTVAIVGANFEDTGHKDAGAAYVFHRDQGGPNKWGQVKKVTASDPQTDVQFGFAVALSGDTLLSSAWFQGAAAYVFEKDHGGSNEWGQRQRVSGAPWGYWGHALSLSGDTALVGNYGDPAAGYFAGSAEIRYRDQLGSNQWGLARKLSPSDRMPYDLFGAHLSVSGPRALVASTHATTTASQAGAVYAFLRDLGGPDAWGQAAKLVPTDPSRDAFFGSCVSLDGAVAAIGASGAASAYVFAFGKVLGEPCENRAECISEHCIDGVCCESSCGDGAPDDCSACSLALGGSVDGKCSDVGDGRSCSDGVFCNGTEKCQSGVCFGSSGDPCGSPDGDADCRESCDEQSNSCTGPDPDDSFCDDGIFCNGDDACRSGSCMPSLVDPCAKFVGDGDLDCTESCNEALRSCSAQDPDGTPCDDGIFCNGGEHCAQGQCSGSSGNPCPGPNGDPNCRESCDEELDSCDAPDPNGSTCEDDLFCNGSERCTDGVCGNSAGVPCSGPDGDEDCAESCDEDTDSCTKADEDNVVCQGDGRCRLGQCVPGPGAACSDENGCSTGFCVNHVCCVEPACSPFACDSAGRCVKECSSTSDCAQGFVCASSGKCVPDVLDEPPPSNAGCGCVLSGPVAPVPWGSGLVLGTLLIRLSVRRRRVHR